MEKNRDLAGARRRPDKRGQVRSTKQTKVSPETSVSTSRQGSVKNLTKIKRREREHLLSRSALLGAASNYVELPPIVLSPIRIGPDLLIENRPAWVEFYVWNRTGADLNDAFVRARIDPRQSIDGYPGIFEFRINELANSATISGAISFILPRADLRNKLTLELCQFGDIPPRGEFPPVNVLATVEIEFDVAARFSIAWDGIYIRDTASRHNDTLFVSLTGQFGELSWSDTASLGDHNNTGRGGFKPDILPVGPFDVFPESGQAIAFACVIANAGHTSTEEDAQKALKVVSHVGAVTATTIMSIIFPFGAAVWALLSAGADELHQVIIDWALSDCDTVVMNDGHLITERDLFLSTFDPKDSKNHVSLPAWSIHTIKKAGDTISEWLGPGCRDSDYAATFSVNRHRAPETVHVLGDDGVLLMPGQEVNFGGYAPGTIAITYEVEGRDQAITPDGLYKAPTAVSNKKFDVIKWTFYTETKRGIEESGTDFCVVLLD